MNNIKALFAMDYTSNYFGCASRCKQKFQFDKMKEPGGEATGTRRQRIPQLVRSEMRRCSGAAPAFRLQRNLQGSPPSSFGSYFSVPSVFSGLQKASNCNVDSDSAFMFRY